MKAVQQKEINSKNNERIVQSKKNSNMILAAFMIFILPIIIIFVGVFIGESIGEAVNGPIMSFKIIGGVVGLIIAGIIIKIFDKSSKIDKNAEKIHWDDL
ncbi:SoxR reducing system RseC family protein [Clostridium sp. BL-8]|uniref:SoxR reducing system RseC family protein n=1 Tax=Clostridium sp. BL-8 TaxID=349938 RepID=UPI00098CBE8B|nr:SoxR reducing system RseC family protein [Clostridium sp. BL-8]